MFACVKCGKQATEGSMQHPYCKECFENVWHGNYKAYNEFLKDHDYPLSEMNSTLAWLIFIPLVILGLPILAIVMLLVMLNYKGLGKL